MSRLAAQIARESGDMQAASHPERHIVYAVPTHSLLFDVKVTHHAAAELAYLISAFTSPDLSRLSDTEFRSLMRAFADEVRS